MTKRHAFTIRYALLCTLTMFLMLTVFGKHYRLDAGFFIPCAATLVGAFLTGWLFFPKQWKAKHLKIGLLAFFKAFALTWLGFLIVRLSNPASILLISALKALADAWLSFVSGILIMLPAFVLLVYVAKGSDKKNAPPEEEEQEKLPE